MTSRSLARLLVLLAAWPCWAAAQADRPDQTAASYFPDAAWQRETPAQAGFNPQRLKEAIDYAIAGESRAPRDLVLSHYQTYGKPDWADRPEGSGADWTSRPRHQPGTVYKYNDVRVNVLALAALSVWRRPLPQVLKDSIMDPIGASNSWRWFGYGNSWVVLDGSLVQSVSGGAHWGGGMFINTYDLGRFGYLTLRHGKWKDRQLISNQWVDWALTPTPVEPTYGFMNWFLNTGRALLPSAPVTAFAHIGTGNNIIYVDPEHDVVAVMRWIEGGAADGFVKRLLAALD
jgi:CubicO group peptidase (beta-lactamase class C family)